MEAIVCGGLKRMIGILFSMGDMVYGAIIALTAVMLGIVYISLMGEPPNEE